MQNEDLFFELNITEDGYVIGRHNHDVADSVSIIGYTEESEHARLFVAAPKLLKALQALIRDYDDFREKTGSSHMSQNEMMLTARAAIKEALGETK